MSLSTFRDTFQHKHILIFGFGILGGGKAVLEVFQQFPCEVIITDQKTEEELSSILAKIDLKNVKKMTLGKHDQSEVDWADIVIKNPAVPSEHPLIQYALAHKKWVTTESALFLKFTDSKTIGITGTRGKTTTTLLTHHLLTADREHHVLLGGNIKDKGSLPLLFEETSNSISVLELSSFALEGCLWEKVSPSIAAITNIFPDHLNRYTSIEHYAQEKANIFLYQKPSDHLFLHAENEWTPFFQKQAHSHVHLIDVYEVRESNSIQLKGIHNRWNAAFAIEIAKVLGVSAASIRRNLSTFTGAPFRQQVVGKAHGKTFINDSTSTTPDALLVALATFPQATFIIGGTTKKLPLKKIAQALDRYKGTVLLLKGSGTNELKNVLHKEFDEYESLQQAFEAAVHTSTNEIVFSPGFASFELFKNEFDRAEQFNQLVEAYTSI